MKQKIIYLLTIVLILNGFSLIGQGWRRFYPDISDLNSRPQIYNAIKSQKNGYILSVGINDTLKRIIKTDFEGREIQIIPTNVNNIGALGSSILEVNDSSIIYLTRDNVTKFNNRGGVVWNNNIKGIQRYSYNASYFSALSDNNKVAIFKNDIDTSSILTFVNVNTGEILFSKNIAPKQNAIGFFKDKMTNGYICITANNQWDVTIFLTDSIGNITQTTRVGYKLNSELRGMKQVENNNFLFITEEVIYKTNAQGDTIWSKNMYFQPINQLPNRVLANTDATLSKDSSSYIFLQDVTDLSSNRTDMLKITKYELNGTEIWSKFITRGNWEVFNFSYTILQASDGGFVASLIGAYLSPDNITREVQLIKTDSLGNIYTNYIQGNVVNDLNQNCRLDSTDSKLKYNYIEFRKGNESFYAYTDVNGNYKINVDTGNYTIKAIPYNRLWESCTDSVIVSIPNFYSVDTINFVMKSLVSCPSLAVDISTNNLSRCFQNDYFVRYCNYGTLTAQNTRVEIKLDSLLEYISSTRLLSSRNGQTLVFNLGDIPFLDCGSFGIKTRTRCGDSTRIGQTLCTEADIYPDSICNPPSNWSGANVIVNGRCDRDSVRFTVKNTTAIPTALLKSKIVEDEIVFLNENRSIPQNSFRVISFPANGKTWRLIQEQEPNNPYNTTVSAIVEGCRIGNGGFSTGFVNDFPNNTGAPSVSISCMPIRGSYDPNEKLAFPEGYKSPHFIEQNTPIDYQIGFQNTGNDTAFTLILRDTLSDFLDISTLKVGVSSHAYTWELVGKNVLIFAFNNINLVDSFHNEAASHGFVKFKINQKKDVALGTKITNQANIYFDFNTPIRTNKTVHTIGKDFIITALQTVSPLPNVAIKVYPNPFNGEATIEIQGLKKIAPLSIESHFVLFDAMGRQLRSEKFEGHQFLFERRDLPTGIYFFKIENGERLVGTGKFLVK